MRIIDRLLEFIHYKRIRPSDFERSCGVSNGYLNKLKKGKGSIGSAIVDKIHKKYPDLNVVWLTSGEGDMIDADLEGQELKRLTLQEDGKNYYTKDEMIKLLQERIATLEASLADKEKIIMMLEKQATKKK